MSVVLLILQIIGLAVRYLPQLLTVIQSIIDFIRHLHKTDPVAAKAMLGQLQTAMVAARKGDPKPMQDLADQVNQACSGGVCSTKG